ncbi:GspE/PulE family protein [Megamonas funiformis]|jgi:type II secretory ATPase GspE/PulE/Tfp pilus assembly ATPase PilB-like protein|uniref:GspE/PulE family protein n=1 Tax=Megamonas funiformis TaxID=437897 RepID=UPI0022E5C316|nr:ATPase, T2SS/T4P/T4SS family [Megamonas funiformis]
MEFITDESLKQKMIDKGKYIDASLVKLNIPANIVALVDKNIAQKYKILPFNYDEEHQTLYIVCNEDALLEQDEIEDIFSTRLNATIKLVLTDNYNLKEALKYYYKVDLNTQSMAHEVQENIEDNAPILNKVKNIIADAIEFGASDIHFLPYKFNNCYSIKILYRINGKNVNHSADYDFTENEIPRISMAIKRLDTSASSDMLRKNMPNKGSFLTKDKLGNDVDVRISTMPMVSGMEKVVLRLQQFLSKQKTLYDIGYLSKDIDIIKNQLKICPTGLFIITGPTGSGKTTTLHAQIGEVVKNADYEKIVVTIEDPVEIYNPNYCQVQIHETEDNATNFSSQKALQVILRQDPEIILYNEIRNKTDAETVIQAGATGHQVFTTLHANDCITAISRLLDLGVSKVSLLNQVNLISSQRLIGILCPHCQREYKLSESDKILLSEEEYNRLSTIDLKQVGTVEQRNNCPHCNHTGYINRIAIVEYVLFNDDLKDILYHTSSMKEIKEALKKNKFISMWEKGLDYVVAGKTSLIELYNQIGNKDAINNLINNL